MGEIINSGVSQAILQMEQRIRHNPQLGEHLLNRVAIGSSVLSIAEIELITRWVNEATSPTSTKTQ